MFRPDPTFYEVRIRKPGTLVKNREKIQELDQEPTFPYTELEIRTEINTYLDNYMQIEKFFYVIAYEIERYKCG